MGQSTDAILCYGVEFEEGYEFPWDQGDWKGDFERWWAEGVRGFKFSKQVYGESDRLPGVTDADVSNYWGEYYAFLKANPLPVELVHHCSGDYPMYILAVTGTVTTASRGYPKVIERTPRTGAEKAEDFHQFCNEHGIELDKPLQWLLCSYWG